MMLGTALLDTSTRFALQAVLGGLTGSLLIGYALLPRLRRIAGERIDSASRTLDELHAAKRGTPTMGGVIIILSMCIDWFGAAAFWLPTMLIALVMMLALAGIGALDDWLKLITTRRGLSARQKLIAQTIVALATASGLYLLESTTADRVHSADAVTRWLHSGWWFIPWAAFVIVAASNAVNLTDGLDGLAAGCSCVASGTLSVVGICIVAGGASGRDSVAAAAVLAAALCGNTAGFLWYNRHPAKIFMGDTGALPIGGLLAIIAILMHRELLLALMGGVFVVETLSVICQVAWFRRTGRRLLLCSPLHNHFVFQRVPERHIVRWFWLAAIGCAMASLIVEVAGLSAID